MNEKLAEDIRLAIGGRSYSQVALITGISKATLSRMIRQTYSKRIKPELLWKLASGSINGITFELLMLDSGFSEREAAIYRAKFENTLTVPPAEENPITRNISHAVRSMLSEEGFSVTQIQISGVAEFSELWISADVDKSSSLYIIDVNYAGNSGDQDRRILELVGYSIFANKKHSTTVNVVTTNPLRFEKLCSISAGILNEVLLASQDGTIIIERKKN